MMISACVMPLNGATSVADKTRRASNAWIEVVATVVAVRMIAITAATVMIAGLFSRTDAPPAARALTTHGKTLAAVHSCESVRMAQSVCGL